MRFLEEDETLLSSVELTSEQKHVKPSAYRPYIRQEANARWFNLVKVPLGMYCLSGTDSTKKVNKMLRRLGEPPVVYDSAMTDYSLNSLRSALQNKGYLHAEVKADVSQRNRRTNVSYSLHPGYLSYVDSIRYEFDDEGMRRAAEPYLKRLRLYKGMPLDVGLLSEERSRLIGALLNDGYYALNKEFVTYSVDTVRGNYGVELALRFACPQGMDRAKAYRQYKLRDVNVYEDINPGEPCDTIEGKGLKIHFRNKLHLYRRVYNDHIYIRNDSLYREADLQNTYSALNSLAAVNYSTVRFREADSISPLLDCDIVVKRNRPHLVSAELEGTNTAGNLGAAVAFTYSNQNIFRGAETFSLKLRGAYEAITGLEGYNNQNYIEYGVDASLRFPKFQLPFVSGKRRQSVKAVSELGLMFNSQNRPEFYRRLLTASWTYRWNRNSNPRWRHRFDLFSLNYVFMPWISDTFRKEYLEGDDPRYSILRYSYEDLFIMKMGYSFVYNSQFNRNAAGLYQTNGYQIKLNVETAGNLLYGLSSLFNASRNAAGQYNLFNIAYSQYAKLDFDYSKSILIDDRNSLAFHAGFGVALPYGNSDIIPYEKRYFSGGANSVRGWNARSLGPGRYVGRDGKIDFINQTGNLKLDFNLEYRTFLFWKIHAAAFIDAGNVWNTKRYADQPEGQFRFDSFYRQIAVSYGIGLRLNFDYFILRFDGAMKAIDPAVESGRLHYPLICPRFGRDFTFHFAVGLPF